MSKLAIVRWYLYAAYLRMLRLRDRLFTPRAVDELEAGVRHALFTRYEEIAGDLSYSARLRNHELKVFSQNGEDGLLAYIFSQVGTTNRRFVEFGVGDGRECNCANLAVNFGWTGLMLEANRSEADAARAYFQGVCHETGVEVRVVEARLTRENIDEQIGAGGSTGEIDLLSIDVDGNDYWLWEALTVIEPRVVVIEYNASFGTRPVTVPYDPDFVRFRAHRSGWYHGASLAALARLGKRLGYDLVATDSRGVNAFFIRSDVPKGVLRCMEADAAYRPQRKRLVVATEEEQFAAIRRLEYVEV